MTVQKVLEAMRSTFNTMFGALVEPQQPLSKYEQALAKQQAERNAK